jgi:DNA-binding response OmpR family regulator
MYHGIVLLLEPDHTLRSHLMECCYAWHWAVYTIDDVASALHALSYPSVRWCLLNVADHPPRADTLAHLHAALRSDQRVILAVAGDQVGSSLAPSFPQMAWVAAPFTRTVLEHMIRPLGWPQTVQADEYDVGKPTIGPRLEIDVVRRRARIGQREIKLSRIEVQLLSYLAQYHGMVCSYVDLAVHLYHQSDADLRRLVQSRMQYLRRKLEPDPLHTRYLHTIRGIGYRLTLNPIDPDTSPEIRRQLQRAVIIDGC